MFTFYVCGEPEEYQACRELQKAIEGKTDNIGFPCVYGVNGQGSLIGFLATDSEHGAVIAGPMVIDPKSKPRFDFAEALGKAYESILRSLKISEYIIYVDKNNNPMLAAIEKVGGYQVFDDDDDVYWYKRLL